MTAGWRADGRSNPQTWRGCPHDYVSGDRCSECGAIPIDGFVQVRTEGGHGANPLGSRYLIVPKLGGVMKAGAEKVTTYNGRIKP